jgi:hypothetical protein
VHNEVAAIGNAIANSRYRNIHSGSSLCAVHTSIRGTFVVRLLVAAFGMAPLEQP